MKAAGLREQTGEELQQMLRETNRELFDLRVKAGGGNTPRRPIRVRLLRRDAARIQTVLRERKELI